MSAVTDKSETSQISQTRARSNSTPPSPKMTPANKERNRSATKVTEVFVANTSQNSPPLEIIPEKEKKNSEKPGRLSKKMSKSSSSLSNLPLVSGTNKIKIPESPSHIPSKADSPFEKKTLSEEKRSSSQEAEPKTLQKKRSFLGFLRTDKNPSTEEEKWVVLVKNIKIAKPSSIEWYRSLGKKAEQLATEAPMENDKKAARKSKNNPKLLDENVLDKHCKKLVKKFKNEALRYTTIPDRIKEFLQTNKDLEFAFLEEFIDCVSPIVFLEKLEKHKEQRELVKEIVGGEGILKLIGEFKGSAKDHLWMDSVTKVVYTTIIHQTYLEIDALKDKKPAAEDWDYQLTKALESQTRTKFAALKKVLGVQEQKKLTDALLEMFITNALAFTTIPSRIQNILNDNQNNNPEYKFLKPFRTNSPAKFIDEWKKIYNNKTQRFYLQELIGGEEILNRILAFCRTTKWKEVVEATFQVESLFKEDPAKLFLKLANLRFKAPYQIGFDEKFPISAIYAPQEVLTIFRAFTADIDPQSQEFFVIVNDTDGGTQKTNVLIPDVSNMEKGKRISHLLGWLIGRLEETMKLKSSLEPNQQVFELEHPRVLNMLPGLKEAVENICKRFGRVQSVIDVKDTVSRQFGIKGFLEFFDQEKLDEKTEKFSADFKKWMHSRQQTIWNELKDLNHNEQANKICDLFIKEQSTKELFSVIPTLFALKAMTFGAFAKAGEPMKRAYPFCVDPNKVACFDIAAFPKEQRFEITHRRSFLLLHENYMDKIVAAISVEWTLKATYDGKNFEASPLKFTDFRFTDFAKTLTMIDFAKHLKSLGLIENAGMRRSYSFN